MTVQSVGSYNNSFDFLTRDIASYRKRGFKVLVLSGSHTRAKRLAASLSDEGIPAFFTEDMETPLADGQIAILYGHASRGFEYPLIKLAVIAESDIFGEKKAGKRKRKARYSGEKIQSFSDLSVGDYVVHENHGLGIYRGIEKMEIDGALKDYIKLEYNGSNLYILATQLDALQKYAGADAAGVPKLSRIGAQEWDEDQIKVRSSVRDIAKDLVQLYAVVRRSTAMYTAPTPNGRRNSRRCFLTRKRTISCRRSKIRSRDMESRKIKNRLICGDVRLRKTEIALRAAFKAVQEGRQVPTGAYDHPCAQHYNTFVQRMMISLSGWICSHASVPAVRRIDHP
jgi:transcription-repair coupling factor (superfamily II helicase)